MIGVDSTKVVGKKPVSGESMSVSQMSGNSMSVSQMSGYDGGSSYMMTDDSWGHVLDD